MVDGGHKGEESFLSAAKYGLEPRKTLKKNDLYLSGGKNKKTTCRKAAKKKAVILRATKALNSELRN